MALFNKSRGNEDTKQLSQFQRTKVIVKSGLFDKLTAQYDTRVQEELEGMILIAQVLNYLMADEVGGQGTPKETQEIIEKIKDEIPYIAVSVMKDETTHRLIVSTLQVQLQICEAAKPSSIISRTVTRTNYLLKSFNPDNKKMDARAVEMFLELANKDRENMTDEEVEETIESLDALAELYLL